MAPPASTRNHDPWTRESITNLLIARYHAGEGMHYSALAADGLTGMYAAARREFGAWALAIDAADLPPEVGSLRHREKRWTKQSVRNAIRERHANGDSLAHSTIHAEEPSLLNGGVRRFGSWRSAVRAAGIDYSKHYRGWERDTVRGVIFENLVDELLHEAGALFERHPKMRSAPDSDRAFVVPDFVLPGDHWIDAKLNAFAPHVAACVERYHPLSEELTIVHSGGDSPASPHARFVTFDDFLSEMAPDMPLDRRRYYERELERIRTTRASKTTLEEWALRWTRDEIVRQIVALSEAGESLVATDVRRHHPTLYGAVHAKQYFSNWYEAVAAAGYDGDHLRRRGAERKRQAKIRFPKAWCVARLGELAELSSDLSAQGLAENEPQLYSALFRHWGSHRAALLANGLDPEQHARQRTWTTDRIVSALRQRSKAGLAITPTDLNASDPNLYSAIGRRFGTLERAARAADIDCPLSRRQSRWVTRTGQFSEVRFRRCLEARRAAGLPLGAGAVLRDDAPLYHAARKHLGGWYEALDALGFDAKSIRGGAARKPTKWTKRALAAAIQELQNSGEDLSVTGMREHGHLAVYASAINRFGSWPAALHAAGLSVDDIRRPLGGPSLWTRETVIAELKRLHQDNADMSVTAMADAHHSVYHAARRIFGNYRDALRACEIDPESVKRGPSRWTRDAIIKALQSIAGERRTLSASEVKSTNPALYDAILANREFRDLEAALAAAGLARERLQRDWSPERLAAGILARKRAGKPLHTSAVRAEDSALFAAGIRFHKTWRGAIEAAGLDYTAVLAERRESRTAAHRKWSDQRILGAIRERARADKSLRGRVVIDDVKGLQQAGSKRFGSWRNAVEAAGLKYDDYVRARQSRKRK